MKHGKLFRRIAYVGAGLLLGLAQTAAAQQRATVKNPQVNLRSTPTAAARNVIATVPQDTEVETLAQQGEWYEVRLPNGQTGWISKWGLDVTAPTMEMERPTPRIEPVLISPDAPQAPEELPAIDPRSSILQSGRQADTSNMALIDTGVGVIGTDENDIAAFVRQERVSRDMLLDELPRRTVEIPAFYIDRREVTNAEYKQFVDATRHEPPLNWQGGLYPPGAEKYPVTFVSWDDANAYAQWAGKRLPTAEEWEMAARGIAGQHYPWGDTFDAQRINMNHVSKGPAAVESYADDLSPYGVYDMGGNVMEWTSTAYQGDPNFYVLKGSSWAGKVFEARGANNTPGERVYQLSHIGFRCAKNATE